PPKLSGNDPPGHPSAPLGTELAAHCPCAAGTARVSATLARAAAARPSPPMRYALTPALVVAVTWTTNSLEGGTAVMGLVIAAAFTVWGVRARRHLGRTLVPAFGPAVVALAVYGIWHRGFPEPTELGWI